MTEIDVKRWENRIMIVIWFMVFCGGVFIIPASVGIMTVNNNAILGLLFGVFCISTSLYYLNKRIRSVLK